MTVVSSTRYDNEPCISMSAKTFSTAISDTTCYTVVRRRKCIEKNVVKK